MRRVAAALTATVFLAMCGPLSQAPAQQAGPPAEAIVDRVRFEPLGPNAPHLTAEGVGAYRGVIEVVPSGGTLFVVNDVGVEDYVKGIVEVPSAWPAEAQKAQAIAARTFALNRVQNPSPAPWGRVAHICPTDSCQVYWGLRGEARAGNENWAAAVDATAGQVLLQGGRPIFSQYSASNGGRSAAGSQPYLRAVDDPDDARSPLNKWSYKVPLATLAPLLGVQAPDTLTAISRQGETVVFTVQSPATPPTTAPVPTLLPGEPAPPPPPPAPGASRQLSMPVGDFISKANAGLGAQPGLPRALPTNRFTLGTEGTNAVIAGGGWGHGIGMSQYGALGKASRGMSAADILAAYYGGIRPSRWNQMPPTLRVALTPDGTGGATVSSPGLFRVLDGQGNPIVPVATGAWRVTPAGAGVRLVPPEDQRGAIVVDAVSMDPTDPQPGAPATLSFAVSTPSLVTVRVVPPGAPAQDLPSQIVGSGPTSVPVPPGPIDGQYYLFVTADAGLGRRGGIPVKFTVGDPSSGEATAPPPPGGIAIVRQDDPERVGAALAAVAALLVFSDVGLAVMARRRRPKPAPERS